MTIVFHPLAWLTAMPKDARFFPSKEVLKRHHPDLPDDQIVETPYVGLTDDRHVVSSEEMTEAEKAEAAEIARAIGEASGLEPNEAEDPAPAPAEVQKPKKGKKEAK